MAAADKPILNSPYDEPARHYATDAQGNLNYRDVHPGRLVFTPYDQPAVDRAKLRIGSDDEAFDRLYGFVSHPIPCRAGRRVAVRVVSQFGEESTKVLQP